jgi:hypothetical protein
MVKIQIGTGYLETQDGTAFPLNFQVGDIRDLSLRKGSFSKTITLTGSKNNNDLLNHYYDVNIQAGTFDINKVTKCAVIQNGVPIIEDALLQLVNVTKQQVTSAHEEYVTYEVLIKDTKAEFFTAITNKELTDLDFTDLNHTFDSAAIVSGFSNTVTDGYKYFLPGSGDVHYGVNEFKPAIFAKTYFDRIFAQAGFSYDWSGLTAAHFDKLIIPYNGDANDFDYKDYLVEANNAFTTSTVQSIGQNNNFQQTINTVWTETLDNQNVFTPATGTYTAPFSTSAAQAQFYFYEVTLNYDLILDNQSGVTAYPAYQFNNGTWQSTIFLYKPFVSTRTSASNDTKVYIYNNPAYVNNSNWVNVVPQSSPIAAGQTTIHSASTTVTVIAAGPGTPPHIVAGNLIQLAVGVDMQPYNNNPRWHKSSLSGANAQVNVILDVTDIRIKILPSPSVIINGGTLLVNEYIPSKIKQSDFVKSVFQMYNLYVDIDTDQPNKLILTHRDDYYDSGKEVDWTYKLDKSKDQELIFLPDLTNKKLVLTYKQDSDDPNKTYAEVTKEVYGQVQYTFDNEYVKDVDTKELIFSPTPITKTIFGAYVPMLAGAAPKTNIRILYDGGLGTCSPYNIYDYGTTGLIGEINYPMVGHFNNPLNPTFDINFATCDFYYYSPQSLTNNNLYNLYWRRTINQINVGKMLIANFNLKEDDIQALKLNDKIRIDNSWWNINKVIDYDASRNTLTKVELISIDTEIDFAPFISHVGTGVPANQSTTQVASTSVLNSKNEHNNIVIGQVTGAVVGAGNVIIGKKITATGNGLKSAEDGIITDNLTLTGTLNGLPYVAPPQKYVVSLTQAGTADPTISILENTFSIIEWTRVSQGVYQGFLVDYTYGDILNNEVVVFSGNHNNDILVNAQYSSSDNCIWVYTTTIGIGLADNLLNDTSVEFRKY